MRRWFWIIALGFSTLLFASFSAGALIFTIWNREFSFAFFAMIFGNTAMAVYVLQLFLVRVYGPLPDVRPLNPSIFIDNDGY